jgi:hypothetical protein
MASTRYAGIATSDNCSLDHYTIIEDYISLYTHTFTYIRIILRSAMVERES